MSHDVKPIVRLLNGKKCFTCGRSVTDDGEKLFMRPHVAFIGSNIEITDDYVSTVYR
mgnify:CR=1 FL=1